MAGDDLRIDLQDTSFPHGEIDLPELTSLTAALQLLATRLGRQQVGMDGRAGRTPLSVDLGTRLRLRGLGDESTDLLMGVGDVRQERELALRADDVPARTVEQFLDIFSGMATDVVPTWVTPVIGDAAVATLDALRNVAGTCVIKTASRPNQITFSPAQVSRANWVAVADTPITRENVEVSGVLRAVDMEGQQRFRLRDDVGNAIVLQNVVNADEVKGLVDTLVTATGTATLAADGRVTKLAKAAVRPVVMPRWTRSLRSGFDLEDVLPGPATDGIDGLADDEVDAFLAELRA